MYISKLRTSPTYLHFALCHEKVPKTSRTFGGFGDFGSRLQAIFAQKEETESDYEEASEEEVEEDELDPDLTAPVVRYTKKKKKFGVKPGRYTYTKPSLSDEDFEYEGRSEAERGERRNWGPGSVLSLRLYKSRKRGNDGRWKLKYRLRQKSNSQVCVSCCMLCALI